MLLILDIITSLHFPCCSLHNGRPVQCSICTGEWSELSLLDWEWLNNSLLACFFSFDECALLHDFAFKVHKNSKSMRFEPCIIFQMLAPIAVSCELPWEDLMPLGIDGRSNLFVLHKHLNVELIWFVFLDTVLNILVSSFQVFFNETQSFQNLDDWCFLRENLSVFLDHPIVFRRDRCLLFSWRLKHRLRHWFLSWLLHLRLLWLWSHGFGRAGRWLRNSRVIRSAGLPKVVNVAMSNTLRSSWTLA